MQEKKIKLNNMKDAGIFVRAAEKCDFDIDVSYNHVFVDGKSILGVLGLDLTRVLSVKYQGYNADFEEVLESFSADQKSAA